MIKKKRNSPFILLLLILIPLLITTCGGTPEPPPPDPEETLKVTEVKFSDTWTGNDIGEPVEIFPYPATDRVYYRIKFEKKFQQDYKIRKAWEKDNEDFLETVCFISKGTNRICGEIHRYQFQTVMEQGQYELFIYYYDNGTPKEFKYNLSVVKIFTIQVR